MQALGMSDRQIIDSFIREYARHLSGAAQSVRHADSLSGGRGSAWCVIWWFIRRYRKPMPWPKSGRWNWTIRRSPNTKTRLRRISRTLSDSTVIIAITSLLAIAVIAFVLRVRPQDLPPSRSRSPFAHLDERKAAIYENLRDLQFEYRVGKLSDSDYQSTKIDLQKQLAAVLAEVDRKANEPARRPSPRRNRPRRPRGRECPQCGAKFERELKFCGECGKAMSMYRLQYEGLCLSTRRRRWRSVCSSSCPLPPPSTASSSISTTGQPQPNAAVTLTKMTATGPQNDRRNQDRAARQIRLQRSGRRSNAGPRRMGRRHLQQSPAARDAHRPT